MRKTTLSLLVPALLLSALLLAGCANDTPSSVPASQSASDRLNALEAEVATLKKEAVAREAAIKQELAMIRSNLAHIQEMLKVQAEAEAMQSATPGESMDEALEGAKESFRKNIDRLTDVTKKLLDQMEREIDEQMKKLAPEPEPQGEKI